MMEDCRLLIEDIEKSIEDVYSPRGLYKVFQMGYFPVPYLWEGREEFARAVDWETKILDGGVCVMSPAGGKMDIRERIARIRELNTESPA